MLLNTTGLTKLLANAKIKAVLPQCYLVFGADQGGILLAQKQIIEAIRFLSHPINDQSKGLDSIDICQLDYGSISGDIDKLYQELFTPNMFGETRIVLVENCSPNPNKEFLEIITKLATNKAKSPAYLILAASEVKKSDKLRQLFENSQESYAIHCYREDDRVLTARIIQYFRDHNITYDIAVPSKIVEYINHDSMILQQELEKISLYLLSQTPKHLDYQTMMLLTQDDGNLHLTDLAYYICIMNRELIQKLFYKAILSGVNEIMLVRVLQKYITRAIQVFCHSKRQKINFEQALTELRIPFFGQQRSDFLKLLQTTKLGTMNKILNTFLEAEIAIKQAKIANLLAFIEHNCCNFAELV